MYGLAAIQQANGWAMAGAGACIVLSGLAVLSFLISMLPRIVGMFDQKSESAIEVKPAAPAASPAALPEDDLNAQCALYQSLTATLGSEFSLVDLHRKSREMDLPHPHLTICRLRDAGLLIPAGEDRFTWQPLSD